MLSVWWFQSPLSVAAGSVSLGCSEAVWRDGGGSLRRWPLLAAKTMWDRVASRLSFPVSLYRKPAYEVFPY